MTKKWWHDKVAYQIYPKSFYDSNGDGIGDIPGIISKLDYLQDLGIDIIWLSPCYRSPLADEGYDISDYYDIDPRFGTMEDMEQLIEEAKKRNMYILMDLVVNHCSDEHEWFKKACEDPDGKYGNFFYLRDKKEGELPTNWRSYFGGPVWEDLPGTDKQYLHVFHKKQPDLNWDNPKVRKEVFDMMTWWCDKGIDGFRMDVISMISKTKEMPDGPVTDFYGDYSPYCIHGPNVHRYLQEMNEKVLSKYDIMTVGETPGVTTEQAKQYAGEDTRELNMVFQFEHVDNHGKYGKWDDQKWQLTKLKNILTRWQTELYGKAWNSLFWDNHDQPRAVSRFGDDRPMYREASAKMLATCLHMMQGSPYIYQGEELGMTNYPFQSPDEFRDIESVNAYKEWCLSGEVSHEDFWPCIIARSRDNARTPVQWDDSAQAGFTTGTPWIAVNPNYTEINAKAETEDPNSVFHYYKKLIALRKENPIMVYGKYETLMEDSEELFVYTRTLDEKKLLTVCNFTDQEIDFTIPEEFVGKSCLIANMENDYSKKEITLRPYEAFVLI